MFGDFYRGKRVFVTGHTGFKGAWLSQWLLELGAEVTGYSFDVPTKPALFHVLGLERELSHIVGDIRDLSSLEHALGACQPDVLFHLAAQSLVRLSYRDPLATFSTNVMGTANVLEAARKQGGLQALVNVTSDKCYENRDWPFGYRETDAMGGADPYSASKGCAELVFSAYARSFLSKTQLRAASARAGNVIGGGDFALDRLVPDCVRAWSKGQAVILRNPGSVRPWQHVLEPLRGYLSLGAALGDEKSASLSGEAFNFGPSQDAFRTVGDLVEAFQRTWPSARHERLPVDAAGEALHEARTLKLSCEKALETLAFQPRLSFEQTLALSARWYQSFYAADADMKAVTLAQLRSYVNEAG